MKATDKYGLRSRVLLVRVTTAGLGLTKIDKAVRETLAEKYRTNKRRVGATKAILDSSHPVLAALLKHRRLISTTFRAMTGPFIDDGYRIITTQGYGNFRAVFDELVSKHADLVEDVIKAYPEMKEQAKEAITGMGDLYDESLYPEAEDLRGIYIVNIETEVLPDRTNTVLDLADVQADALRTEGAALEKKRLDGVIEHAHEVVADGLNHMIGALRAYGDEIPNSKRTRSFKDTLVSNMGDMAALMKSLNVNGCSKIDALSSRIAADLTVISADRLRGNKNSTADKRTDEEREAEASKLREQTADTAEELLDDLADIFGGEG